MKNKLMEYLTENGIGHNFFARKVGSSPAAMSRYLKGSIPSLKLAIAIEQATTWTVHVYDWVSSKKINTYSVKKNQKHRTKKID